MHHERSDSFYLRPPRFLAAVRRWFWEISINGEHDQLRYDSRRGEVVFPKLAGATCLVLGNRNKFGIIERNRLSLLGMSFGLLSASLIILNQEMINNQTVEQSDRLIRSMVVPVRIAVDPMSYIGTPVIKP